MKVPLDAITDRLRESEDADYCAAVIERRHRRVRAASQDRQQDRQAAEAPQGKVAAAELASEQWVEAESKSSKHVMTFKIPL